MTPFMRSACVAGIVVGVCLIAFVFLTGSSFGQRCARAYPDSGLDQERCVGRLAVGGKI